MVDLEALARECGVQLYDVETVSENGRTIYRISITKAGGLGLDDCERLSRLLSPIYDVEPPLEGEWTLEVGSPGLERKLSKPQHFANSVGELVRLSCTDGQKLSGEVLGCEGGVLRLRADGGEVSVRLDEIKKARTYVQW